MLELTPFVISDPIRHFRTDPIRHSTQIYLHASLKIKEQALDKTKPTNGKPGRYHPDDNLIAFLKGL